MANESPRCVNYAVGVRKRLQEDARHAGWRVSIPRYALVDAVHTLLGPGIQPAEHGRKPRVVCSGCNKMRPATLHWSEASLEEQPATVGVEAARCVSPAGRHGAHSPTARGCLRVMCRRCVSLRGVQRD